MHGEDFFHGAFVYLSAAVVAVPLAKRLGLGSVLGYLIAGMVIGPFGLGLVGHEGHDVMHFAEFGVVLMLFLVGLELEPRLLWRLRMPLLGLGGLQVVATTAAITAVGIAFDLSLRQALAVGMILSLSSTAIVLQTLKEKALMKTGAGQSAFSVLLFQDLAVIPMLALLPLLASGAKASVLTDSHGSTWVAGLPGWLAALVMFGCLGAIIGGGHYLLRPAFRAIARTRLRETFTAAALLLVIGIALLMTKLGLSPALGTFVAGVVLATNEYRHELESEIEPFKGLLLGLFFLSVGASIDFEAVAAQPDLIATLVLALMALKFAVLFMLGRIFRMGFDQNLVFSFALAQSGEFAFVLFSFAVQNDVIPVGITSPLVAAVALTMALTPVAMIINERLILPRVGTRERSSRQPDAIHGDTPVIIAGYGRFGQIVARLLGAVGYPSTLLEIDSDQVDLVRKYGTHVFYGDATRHDLLQAAGAAEAKILVIAIDNHEKTLELVQTARKHFPHLRILARAPGRRQAFELVDAGVNHIYREVFDSSLRMGRDALQLLGMRAYQAHRAARTFRRHDERSVREHAKDRDQENFINLIKERNRDLERVLREDREQPYRIGEQGWESSSRGRDAA